jgi:hypothetical protein
MSAYRSRRHDFVLRWYEFEYSRIVLRVVRLHCSCGLRALKAEAQLELTDVLDVSAVLTGQDDAFRNLADCVHDAYSLWLDAGFLVLDIGHGSRPRSARYRDRATARAVNRGEGGSSPDSSDSSDQ